MDNKTVRRIGVLFIISTILVDILFTMESTLVFNTTAVFLLGAVNVMALNFIRVIFKFKIESMDFYTTPALAFSPEKKEALCVVLNKSLLITLKQ